MNFSVLNTLIIKLTEISENANHCLFIWLSPQKKVSYGFSDEMLIFSPDYPFLAIISFYFRFFRFLGLDDFAASRFSKKSRFIQILDADWLSYTT